MFLFCNLLKIKGQGVVKMPVNQGINIRVSKKWKCHKLVFSLKTKNFRGKDPEDTKHTI